jgi:5-methylcytosine-specific restriction endonuclease McrA
MGFMREVYNDGKWTSSRFNSFIKSILRSGSRRWEPKYTTLNKACVGQKINIKTGRLAKHYKCAGCQQDFPAKEIQIDHIRAIIDPNIGFISWDSVVENMFCEADNLQALCLACHKIKSNAEKQIAKERKNG